jgi:hypothetical protein
MWLVRRTNGRGFSDWTGPECPVREPNSDPRVSPCYFSATRVFTKPLARPTLESQGLQPQLDSHPVPFGVYFFTMPRGPGHIGLWGCQ